MEKRLLIYGETVPVSRQDHADLSVEIGETYDFARRLQIVPVMVSEFAKIGNEHPIVFSANDAATPVAVLSAHAGRNNWVDGGGMWYGRYVPAFLRQYPFVFSGSDGSDRLTLCIDQTAQTCNRDGRGSPLFGPDGEATDFLQDQLKFMEAVQSDFARTRRFVQRLDELGLLTQRRARGVSTAGPVAIDGFKIVDEAALRGLDGDTLKGLLDQGIIGLIYTHLNALHHFGALMEG